MEKKIYNKPLLEVTDITGVNPLALGDTSGKANPAPPRRDPVF